MLLLRGRQDRFSLLIGPISGTGAIWGEGFPKGGPRTQYTAFGQGGAGGQRLFSLNSKRNSESENAPRRPVNSEHCPLDLT